MRIRSPFLAITLLGVIGLPASAQGLFSFDPAEGGYIASGFVGGAFSGDVEYKGSQTPAAGVPGTPGAPAIIDADFDSAALYGASIGYQLPFKYWTYFHPRLELEVSTFEADVSSGQLNKTAQTFNGTQSATSFLINNYNDIEWSDNQIFVPFIGGGIGVTKVDADLRYGGTQSAPAPTFGLISDDTVFTSTFGVGLSYRWSEGIEIYGEGRITTLYDVQQERRFIANGANGLSAKVEDNNITNGAVIAGARFRF